MLFKVCLRLEEERRAADELRSRLEKEKEELRKSLKDATTEVCISLINKYLLNPISCEGLVNCLRALRSRG